MLRRAGIPRAVLAASSLHADGNGYAVAVTQQDPSIRTTVIVGPDVSADYLAALDRSGACGIRLQLRNKELPDLQSRPYRQLLRQVADLGWHVQLHDDARRLPPLIEAIETSGAPLVIDHFGRPGPDGHSDPGFRAVLAAIRRGRTWVKISAAYRLAVPAQDQTLARAMLDVRGPDRLLWGSDWPFVGFEKQMTYAKALDAFARAVPVAAMRTAIHDTTQRFYFPDL